MLRVFPSVTLFLLVRHASHDLLGRTLAGRMPGVHLNERGRREALWLRDRLQGERVEALYASPLERSRETAAPIAEALGLIPQIEPAFSEMAFGEWTGRDFADLERIAAWKAFNACRTAAGVPGGETMLETQSRAVKALERLRECHGGSTVVVVSHGDVIRAAVAHYLGLSLDLLHRFEIEPASITTLRVADHGATLLRLNESPAPSAAAPAPGSTPALAERAR
jgi:probable phosphomutase (TIGR03848 family)